MSTDVQILNNYLARIKAHNNSVGSLSIFELFDMRAIALRVMEAVLRAAQELDQQGIDPNKDRHLLKDLTIAETTLALVGRTTLAGEVTKRGTSTLFKVVKFAVTTGLPFTAAAGLGALATYWKMGGSIPGISQLF